MISAKGLTKSYGKVRALEGVSFDVGRGELFGLIGADGSGKTTLLRILSTLLLPDEGSAEVAGHDVVREFRAIRAAVGYMPGRFSLYQDLSVEENLRFFATVFGTTPEANYDRIRDIYVQLEPFKNRRAGALSGGMKQKLALCCALVHRPEVLLLDEPTTGVDPVSRREFWDMLARLKEEGIAIMVSTPYMDEAGRCDRVALMREGRILGIDTPEAFVEGYGRTLWAAHGKEMYPLLLALRESPAVESAYAFGDRHHVTLREGYTIPDLQKSINAEIEQIRPTIEDVYLAMR